MSATGKLHKIETFLEKLGKDYPSETEAFLNFMQKAEGAWRWTGRPRS